MKVYIVLFTIGIIGLISCGNDSGNTNTENGQSNKTEKQKVFTEEAGTIELTIRCDDSMKYDTKEIRVKPGTAIQLTLQHTGKLSKKMMGHNFVLINQDASLPEVATDAAKAADNNYIPADDPRVLANTDMIGGGESTTITFETPEKGEYIYFCSFPGHYSLMNGKLIVE